MAKEEPGPAQLVHHYTHVVCALNETRKGSPSDPTEPGATDALSHTIKGVCQLIDSLVAQEQRDMARSGVN